MKNNTHIAPSDERTSAQKKTLSTTDGVFLVVGIVIGAGIFQFPMLVAMNLSSFRLILSAWFLGGLISLIGALCYAELASSYPNAGGDYHFINRAFGTRCSFLFAYARMLIIQPGSVVMIAFIGATQCTAIVSLGVYSESLYAAFIVLVLTFLNMRGIRQGTRAQRILTTLLIAGLASVIVLAFAGPPHVATAEASLQTSPQTLSGFGLAMVFVLLTYGGWNEAAYVSAEIRRPERSIVKALMIGLTLITLMYLLANTALYYALGHEGMRDTDAYRMILSARVGPHFSHAITLLVIAATLSTANATIITGARSNYALGRDFRMFRFMNSWRHESGAPIPALVFQAVICLLLIVLGTLARSGLEAMVDYTSPAFWFFFLLAGLSLFVLRWKDPQHIRPYRVPLYPITPALFVIFCVYMLKNSLAYTGRGAWFSVGVIFSGLIVYSIGSYLEQRKR